LFTDGFACLVAKSHPVTRKRLPLKTFLAYPYVEIRVTNGRTPYIGSSLAVDAVRRQIVYRTRFPLSAALITATSRMITRRLAVWPACWLEPRICALSTHRWNLRTLNMEWPGTGAFATTSSSGCGHKFALQLEE
jgi:hypothetical protein